MSAAQNLSKQFRGCFSNTELSKNGIPGFYVYKSDSDQPSIGLVGPPDTLYAGGYFKAAALLKFPQDFPFNPPSFTFTSDIYHPNVYSHFTRYPDGKLCISILHPPGDDPMSGETAQERWNPTQSVESILFSIVSLLSDPNPSSPANLDAAVAFRNDRPRYEAIVKQQVEYSKKNIPENYNIKPPSVASEMDNDDFWDEDEGFDDDEDDFD